MLRFGNLRFIFKVAFILLLMYLILAGNNMANAEEFIEEQIYIKSETEGPQEVVIAEEQLDIIMGLKREMELLRLILFGFMLYYMATNIVVWIGGKK